MLIFCVFNEQKQAVEIKKLHFKSEANWKKYEFVVLVDILILGVRRFSFTNKKILHKHARFFGFESE